MKKLTLLLLLIVASTTLFAQQKKAKRDTLYTITASRIHIVDGKPTNDFTIYNLKWADTLWNVSRDLDMEQPDLSIKNYRWYFYDEAKRPVRFERYVNEKLDCRVRYFYGESLLTERAFYSLSGKDTVLTRKDVITRNGNGQVSKIRVMNEKGKAVGTFSYSYDAKGNEIKMKGSMKTILDADSVLSRKAAYSYDSLGRVAKKVLSVVKADKSKQDMSITYSYGKDGKLTAITRYGTDGKMLGKEEIIYYSGRVSQRKYYNADGVLTENLAYRYRKFGASVDNNMY